MHPSQDSNSKSRRFGVFYPLPAATAGVNELVNGTLHDGNLLTPADLHVTFVRNQSGACDELVWKEGGTAFKGTRVFPHRNEDVVFHNGNVTLHGTLTLLEAKGPHPTVILLQEAGPRSRPFIIWPYLFARFGIAMLTFDKRGCGESSGEWQTASFQDLAGDATAALRLLRARPDIDSARIGLWGNSNSGWVLPLVATESRDVAFLIDRVGSALPPTENVLYEIENQMRAQGFSEEEIEKAVSLRRMLQNAIVNDAGWDQFAQAATAARNERWFPLSRVGRYASAPLLPDKATLQKWRNPLAFDPAPFWAKVTCPVLAIYGEADKSTPTTRNVERLVTALKQAGNKRYKTIILPGAGHSFYEFETNSGGYTSEIPPLQRYLPGYVDAMMDWLMETVRR